MNDYLCTKPFLPLKKALKISGFILAGLLLLIFLSGLLLQTDWCQKLLVDKATQTLTRQLGSEVAVKKVSFSLFNRAYLEGTLIRDRKKDTLLYAGSLTISITDWFFLKKEKELHYLGLKDAKINLRRTDSIWNYQFIADFLTTTPKKQGTDRQPIQFSLKKIELGNLVLNYLDGWKGQDMVARIGHLVLIADSFDLAKKKIHASSVDLEQPYFSLYDYTGNRPDSLNVLKPDIITPGVLRWNPDEWELTAARLNLKNGEVRFLRETQDKLLDWFDPDHIVFDSINSSMQNVAFKKDTLSAFLNLSTHERSGFQVDRLEAQFTMHPEAMIFERLDIKTPYSHLKNYYSMRYKSFNSDMADFIHQVKLEGRFTGSTIGARDIAYFAPELSRWNDQKAHLDGRVTGTVDDLNSKNFTILYGQHTSINGDMRITDLPDLDKTVFDLHAERFQTDHGDMTSLAPELAQVKGLDLRSIGIIRTRGNFKGTLRDFHTDAELETALGNAQANVHMSIPHGKAPTYSGTLYTSGFELGRLIKDSSMGRIAFNGSVKGTGFDLKNASVDVNGKVNSITWNDYTYTNVDLHGILHDQRFNGQANIDDPNFKARLDGKFDLDPSMSQFDMTADVQRANLKPLNFTGADMRILGKFKLNFRGAKIDDMIGEASLYDVALTKNEETFVFDTLYLNAANAEGSKKVEIKSSDVDITLTGKYNISEIPATVRNYLNKYYPLYFSASSRPLPDQDLTLNATLHNISQYLPLFDRKLNGLDNSIIQAHINTNTRTLNVDAQIPFLSYNKTKISDISILAKGDLDSLRTQAKAGLMTVNDSLQFPFTTFTILSAGDVSDIHFSTAANQTINAADLSARITNLKDGLRFHFNPSSVVLNEKTWRIVKDGELTISRSLVEASEVRIVNGEQEIRISSIPSSTGYTNDLILNIRKVNLGDFIPILFKDPKIEGITSGDITVEDPLNKLRVYVNAQTEQTRFENDSIGTTSFNGYWDNARKYASYHLISDNPGYVFKADGYADILDSSDRKMDVLIDIQETRIKFLETYLKDIFTDIRGTAVGQLRINGNLREPDLTGSIQIHNGSMTVDFTKCRYTLQDPIINFKPDEIDFGEITVRDTYGNTGLVNGRLTHHFFRNMGFDFKASSDKMLLLNTTKTDNSSFYGKAIGKTLFQFTGPEDDMRMFIKGEPVDSSFIDIVTYGSSKQKSDVDYIVWKQYGREMNVDSLKRAGSNLTIDLDLTANPLAKLRVVLDEQTGDVISATGKGNMKIHTASNQPITMTGRYNIDNGFYNFNFQDIFQKPFKLEQGSGSYLSWNGDPYNAEINVNATYLAEKVRMSTLFDDPASSTISGVNSDVLKELSDVSVICTITGSLNQPQTAFQIAMPVTSSIRNNPTVDARIKNINRDQNEASKQSTYLIVFKSFAPQAAIVTSDLNTTLINNTISGVINAILANSLQNFFYKVFGSSMNVNLNYSRMITNATGTASDQGQGGQNVRENVSLEFIKSLMDNKLVITLGSDFNFSATGNNTITSAQSFLFLPDVNVEYKITPDGKLRTSFFYRSSFDALSTSGRRDRTGGNISYRTEFNTLFGKPGKREELPITKDSMIEKLMQ